LKAATSGALPERLRLETRALHAATERTGAMAALLAGRLPRAAYVAMLRNLHAIYAALETALQAHADAEAVAALQAGSLGRATPLADDLAALHGPAWASELPLTEAARHYVARLHALLAAAAPAAAPPLVAHAYVRYLGDLHGGQVLQRLVGRRYGLSDEAGAPGTRFYDFGSTPQVLALRQQLRAALGGMPFDGAEQDAVVAEACWAFEQHQRLFSELLPGA
jgi:heme oxygenase (biliverdin-producing, ferredoxin)